MMNCKNCTTGFEVTKSDRQFYDKVSPIINGQKYLIPEPTLCPDCRLQRRMVWRNERSLYRRKCDSSGESIISWIAPDKPYKVYKRDIWWGDSWNALDHGRDFDFNRPFFEQLDKLIKEIPWIGLLVDRAYNSDYINFCYNNKDCYLIYASNNNESCYYGSYIWGCKNCLDCLQAFDCELCYGCVDINNCYSCQYSKNCNNCRDCLFCENCQNCKNCFGCVNLVGKEYYFMNEQLSKEAYEDKIKNLQLDSYQRIQETRQFFNEHRLKFPMRFVQMLNCENSTGDAIRNCKNTKESFDISDAEDCKWVMIGNGLIKDCYDVIGVEDLELSYETVVSGVPATRTYFSAYAWKNAHDVLYSVLCAGSNNCFGTVGVSKKKYCILNKQYSKEGYEELVPKIIKHMQGTEEWGEFFPINLSPFDYNETMAQDYFPLTEEEVKERSWRWRKKEEKEYQQSNYQIPDSIKEVSDEITNQVLSCKECNKNYKIIPQELNFYRQYSIPIPQNCSNCRLTFLMHMRNPRRLWDRNCSKCQTPIQTTYSPDRPETVYCEECYLSEVY